MARLTALALLLVSCIHPPPLQAPPKPRPTRVLAIQQAGTYSATAKLAAEILQAQAGCEFWREITIGPPVLDPKPGVTPLFFVPQESMPPAGEGLFVAGLAARIKPGVCAIFIAPRCGVLCMAHELAHCLGVWQHETPEAGRLMRPVDPTWPPSDRELARVREACPAG